MKRIKKVLAVVLVLVMSMALAAGCSKSRQTMVLRVDFLWF